MWRQKSVFPQNGGVPCLLKNECVSRTVGWRLRKWIHWILWEYYQFRFQINYWLKTTTTLFKLSSFIWLDVIIEYITAGYWTVINILALTSSPNKLWNSLAYKSSFADCSIPVMYNIHVTFNSQENFCVFQMLKHLREIFKKKITNYLFFQGLRLITWISIWLYTSGSISHAYRILEIF